MYTFQLNCIENLECGFNYNPLNSTYLDFHIISNLFLRIKVVLISVSIVRFNTASQILKSVNAYDMISCTRLPFYVNVSLERTRFDKRF